MNDLDRQIAELLGYTEIERFDHWEETFESGPYEVQDWKGRYRGEERLVPRCQTDLRATATICMERNWELHLYAINHVEVHVPRLERDGWTERAYVSIHNESVEENAARALLEALRG